MLLLEAALGVGVVEVEVASRMDKLEPSFLQHQLWIRDVVLVVVVTVVTVWF